MKYWFSLLTIIVTSKTPPIMASPAFSLMLFNITLLNTVIEFFNSEMFPPTLCDWRHSNLSIQTRVHLS